MSPPAAFRRYVLSSFASLASAVPLFRPGSSLPGSAAPLMGAPPADSPDGLSHPPARRLRATLGASVVEGMFTEVFTACAGATVLTAWAIALKLGPLLVGVMTALPFLAQFVQFPAAWLTSAFGHRRVALTAVCLSRLVMFPLAILPWLELELAARQHVLLVVAGASALLGVVGNNAWVAWMGELVPRAVRGRFFGRRTALTTLAGTLASLCAGLLMDRLRPSEGLGVALPLLALGACVMGVVTTLLMASQHDPAPPGTTPRLELKGALVPLKDPLARRVLTYQVAWNAAVGVSAPFFALHSLQNLKMTFVIMALHAAAVAGVRILTAPLWGKMIDKVGAQPVLMACSLGIGVIPALWLLPSAGTLWPLLFDVLLAGALWSGHGLAIFALPLSVAPRKGRPFYLAAFATAGGLAYSVAAALGGAIASALPETFILGGKPWVNLHVLFVVSSVARLAAGLLAARLPEPGAHPVTSMSALVSRLLPRTRASRVLAPPSTGSHRPG
ncbi:MFS transporter [Myxococcus llanfairpwllgwyngyllgogerychwyrndrobwllllantysiliogogogochensis]|uniref:MFS transporter n=2 Tax=Myxococcus llanfairpwllgwyngyllgogerychwyrndrobwllllantysiliogogogochensis TaxID=2590453 RepID=A0A540X445_9BACT|nr:MFS transporter [Myxococcus llanfairpwllgwyngyllgogerychwyrndrobwllllantysiliogogogochensis]TQF16015.1 MFS transporter [Myxococcus llanfairpwllgwyngyllgogerychwyrndrobwllllantysiliogogogochensis]